ncbi:similar to ADA2 2A [Actinidia rufa]|uniref:Similar to ADA2 2A n=1 Tax=Actinidia rufa TaxID=165716 RepID=A0A7J0G364_9ERIC|nr:similar to ADA2 2A [Actinidia rufa]
MRGHADVGEARSEADEAVGGREASDRCLQRAIRAPSIFVGGRRGSDEAVGGFPTLGELTVKEEPPLSARVKVEDQRKEGSVGRSSSSLISEIGTGAGAGSGKTSVSEVKKASQINDGPEDIKEEDSHADRSIGEKKPRMSGDEGPSMKELSGYNSKRQEFEIEYDNDAEQLLADMEFKGTDSDAERELKLRVLRIYSKRLDERKRRKEFILERDLLYPDPFEKNLSPEEREVCRHYRVFMRFHSKEEHEELLKSVIEEHRILKRIQDLQEARAAGCRTSAQAERYIEEKRKKEAEETAHKLKDSAPAGPSDKFLQRANHLKGEPNSSPQGNAQDSSLTSAGQANSSFLEGWDISGFLGADLLSETEKQLCCEIKILPSHYLSMSQTMSVAMLNGNITQKSDAHGLFKVVDPSKVDRVYDMLVKKGIGQP